jgi:hypothetical protein
MPHTSQPSDSVVAAVRAYFQLTQAEMAAWLGVTKAQASHLGLGKLKVCPHRGYYGVGRLASMGHGCILFILINDKSIQVTCTFYT